MNLRSCFSKVTLRSPLLVNSYRGHPLSLAQGSRTFILKPTSPHGGTAGIIQQLKTARQTLDHALKRRRADDLSDSIYTIRRIFFSLPRNHWITATSSPEYFLLERHKEVERVLSILTKHAGKENARTLDQFLRDLKTVYGVEPDMKLLSDVLEILIRAGLGKDAYDTLYYFWNKKSSFRPDSTHWSLVMCELARLGESSLLRKCVDDMKASWPFPKIVHYEYLIEGMLYSEQPLTVEEVHQLLDEIATLNLPYSDSIYSKLSDLNEKMSLKNTAESFSDAYKNCYSTRTVPSGAQFQSWLSSLHEQRSSSKSAFETKLRLLRQQGFIPTSRTLARILQLRGVTSVEEIIYLKTFLEVEANVICWSIVLKNALEKQGQSKNQGWRPAKAVYQAAREQGITPDSAMVDPLLRAMCGGQISGISEEALNDAVWLYDDFITTSSSSKPDVAIFNTLLRALTSSSNKEKHFPTAMRVLEDMRRLSVEMDPMTATSVAVLLIRSCSTFEEAGETYRRIRDLNGGVLDAKGYTAVLHAFCSLDIELNDRNSLDLKSDDDSDNGYLDQPVIKHRSVPPSSIYFEIVNDMQTRGFTKTSEVYTILLGRYAALSTRAQRVYSLRTRHSLLVTLRNVISETHHRITLDATLDLDPPLLNQLMDAYNRVGDFGGVMTVWALLTSGGKVTPTSISVIFDACGFSGAYETANRVFKEIREMGMKMNRRNWNAWIECLGRLGRLEEAFDVVSEGMRIEENLELPDEEAVKILLSFAAKAGKVDEIRERLHQRFPELN